MNAKQNKTELFEQAPVPRALATMALPTIVSQLITLVYNIADTWFIGRANNPYMVAASSLCLTVFLMTAAISTLFGTGGGSHVVRLLGEKREEDAAKAASYSLAMAAIVSVSFSLLVFVFMNPFLRALGASDDTIGYAKSYLLYVVVIGTLPTVLSNTMATLLRNVGYASVASFGLGMGGVLNILLDPLFMFVILPRGNEVAGAGIATMLSNCVAFLFFVLVYLRVQNHTVLSIPRRLERIGPQDTKIIYSVGVPAALGLLLFDLATITINRLTASHGDLQLAAMGIVLKVERLSLNTNIGICLGMVPLVAYNYAANDYPRMRAFFSAARFAGLAVSLASVVLYYVFAPALIRAFIADAETVRHGIRFLRARCFAPPFMFLSFHMVNYMQAIGRGNTSFLLAVIRQLVLNIPLLFLFNRLFGMMGIVWTQVVADTLNVLASYVIYYRTDAGLYHRDTKGSIPC